MAERTGELRRDVAELLDRVEALEREAETNGIESRENHASDALEVQTLKVRMTMLEQRVDEMEHPLTAEELRQETDNVTGMHEFSRGVKDTATGEQAPIYPIRESSGDFTISPYPEEQSSAGATSGEDTRKA